MCRVNLKLSVKLPLPRKSRRPEKSELPKSQEMGETDKGKRKVESEKKRKHQLATRRRMTTRERTTDESKKKEKRMSQEVHSEERKVLKILTAPIRGITTTLATGRVQASLPCMSEPKEIEETPKLGILTTRTSETQKGRTKMRGSRERSLRTSRSPTTEGMAVRGDEASAFAFTLNN